MIYAMDYEITIEDSGHATAPTFDEKMCYESELPCYCFESQAPQAFFQKAGSGLQSMKIKNVSPEPMTFVFEYHSGICFQVLGSRTFSTRFERPDNYTSNEAVACYDNSFTLERNGSSYNISIIAFERYPKDNTWTGKVPTYDIFNISGVQVRIIDNIKNVKSQVFNYSAAVNFNKKGDRAGTTSGFVYSIEPINLNPVYSFGFPFKIEITRNLYGVSEVTGVTYQIPLTGMRQ
jgi:hypothetical protein